MLYSRGYALPIASSEFRVATAKSMCCRLGRNDFLTFLPKTHDTQRRVWPTSILSAIQRKQLHLGHNTVAKQRNLYVCMFVCDWLIKYVAKKKSISPLIYMCTHNETHIIDTAVRYSRVFEYKMCLPSVYAYSTSNTIKCHSWPINTHNVIRIYKTMRRLHTYLFHIWGIHLKKKRVKTQSYSREKHLLLMSCIPISKI